MRRRLRPLWNIDDGIENFDVRVTFKNLFALIRSPSLICSQRFGSCIRKNEMEWQNFGSLNWASPSRKGATRGLDFTGGGVSKTIATEPLDTEI